MQKQREMREGKETWKSKGKKIRFSDPGPERSTNIIDYFDSIVIKSRKQKYRRERSFSKLGLDLDPLKLNINPDPGQVLKP